MSNLEDDVVTVTPNLRHADFKPANIEMQKKIISEGNTIKKVNIPTKVKKSDNVNDLNDHVIDIPDNKNKAPVVNNENVKKVKDITSVVEVKDTSFLGVVKRYKFVIIAILVIIVLLLIFYYIFYIRLESNNKHINIDHKHVNSDSVNKFNVSNNKKQQPAVSYHDELVNSVSMDELNEIITMENSAKTKDDKPVKNEQIKNELVKNEQNKNEQNKNEQNKNEQNKNEQNKNESLKEYIETRRIIEIKKNSNDESRSDDEESNNEESNDEEYKSEDDISGSFIEEEDKDDNVNSKVSNVNKVNNYVNDLMGPVHTKSVEDDVKLLTNVSELSSKTKNDNNNPELEKLCKHVLDSISGRTCKKQHMKNSNYCGMHINSHQ